MNHKFFSIKELKESLENHPVGDSNPIIEISLAMLKSMSRIKKPEPKNGPVSFSYKNINLN